MRNKYAVITGFMGQIQDRFATYGVDRSFEQMVQTASTVKGCSGRKNTAPMESRSRAMVSSNFICMSSLSDETGQAALIGFRRIVRLRDGAAHHDVI